MDKFPVYKMIIDINDEEDGFTAMGLVDNPANEQYAQVFTKYKQQFQINDEKRIVTGAFITADLPIYRRNDGNEAAPLGEYYVVFDRQNIQNLVFKIFKNANKNPINLFSTVDIMHDPNKMVNDCFMFESFIIDSARGIKTPEGFDVVPDGSWFGSYYIGNDDVWNNFIKGGKFKGFSIEGIFGHEPHIEVTDEAIEAVRQVILG